MNITEFRNHLLAVIRQVKSRHPDAQLHLVYAPELSDPLALALDERRETAYLGAGSGSTARRKEACPRLVTLDCRRVAGYLLENDPGLDDPLLEASIAQAHAEVCAGEGLNRMVTNDEPGHAESAVCGWIVSPETAAQLASRINRHATPARDQERPPQPGKASPAGPHGVRWYQPDYFGAVWPTLDTDQRQALLGAAVWLAHTATGDLQEFAAGALAAPPPLDAGRPLGSLGVVQWRTVDNVALVTQMTQQWKTLWAAQGRALPRDATQQLHRHVSAAQAQTLDDENLVLYVMTAVQLIPGATDSPAFRQVVRHAATRDASLREGLRSLPAAFWERHAAVDDAAGQVRVDDAAAVREARRPFHRPPHRPPHRPLFPPPDEAA